MEHWLPHFKEVIERNLTDYAGAENDEGRKRWGKWKWLADYHNHALATSFEDPGSYVVDAGEALHRFHPFGDTIDNMPPAPPPGPGARDDDF